ncbi:MAG: DUF262 domain-containing protein [Verrucomicrobia bacterium]|nr:DUF262 domain-containing protein [Verrucomicrobiota bacterium]
MATELSFEAHDQPLESVLFSQNSKFRIPRYQRPYAWTEDQLADFWNDLNASDSPYFLGSFIFNLEPKAESGFVEVIDGQQRMLTVTILMAVLRDLVREIDPTLAERIQRQDIAIEDRNGKLSYRIECGDSTKPFFEKHIQDRDSKILSSAPNTPEEARIKANYDFLKIKVEEALTRCNTKEEQVGLIERLRKKVSELVVIQIQINSEEDAYEIFETTNARGVDLSIGDLLKNLIFKKIKAQEDRDFAKEVWADILNDVQETSTELKRFIRYYWISKYALVTEKHLFREIKKQTTDWQKLLEDLWAASASYNKLMEGERSEWVDVKHGARIYKSLTALKIMGVSQCYVLLLSILRNYQRLDTDPTRVFELIEKFTFNYSAICKLQANKVEKIYSAYARRIEDCVANEPKKKVGGKIQSIFSQLEEELRQERPSYEVFKDSFDRVAYGLSERSRQLAKYILSEINALETTGEHALDFDVVNIEHILPQNPCKEWGLSKKQIKGYVNKLGNLTLVGKTFNSKMGNRIIPEKIEALAESEIPMTQQLVKHLQGNGLKWDEADIEQRQAVFADVAYNKVWSF